MDRSQTDQDFERRARLAVIWEDLINPVRSIVSYQEIVLAEAGRIGASELLPDLDKVMVAARGLLKFVNGLRDPETAVESASASEPAELQGRLRHDLRTSLNAVIGYSEIVLEDIDAVPGADCLHTDLESLLSEARRLLSALDVIVDFSRGAGPASGAPDAEHVALLAMVDDLMQTLGTPVDAKPQETGRILVVDDTASNREVLSRRLALDGHDVVTAESGVAALRQLDRDSVDLILLDLLMPEMNGFEVLTRLKTDERWHAIPVIMVSSLHESDAVMKCIELGAEDYLPKPCDVVLLRARINACLERNRWRERERIYLAELEVEKAKSDRLLRSILPHAVVLRLNDGETAIADGFNEASILFADIVGFTPAAALMSPARLVGKLDQIFTAFDKLAMELGVEKIKTIGDAYMAATGLPEPRQDHVEVIADFAVGILDLLQAFDDQEGLPLKVRIGLHTGPVVAGVIGSHKFIYDVWGDTVNLASRLESHGEPDRIHVSQEIVQALADRYEFEARGEIMIKGKGMVPAYFLLPPMGRRPR